MKFLILLCLVPMVTSHYGRRYNEYVDEDEYELEDERYGDDYDRPGRRHFDDMEHPMPFRPRPLMRAIKKIAAGVLKPTDQNINLKVSGKVEMVKSFKGSNNPWDHWMKQKMDWMKHIHQHLHDMDRHHHHEHHDMYDHDHDDEDDEEEDDDDDDEFHASKNSIWERRQNCPFWITKQFLKMCKCPTINGMMAKMMGHPVKPFERDPMRVFNNTPGLEELRSGNINKLLNMVQDIKPQDAKKLFFAGMIQSMCKEAKKYVHEVQNFEKAAQARAKASIISATKKFNLVQRNLATPPRVPLAKQKVKGGNSEPAGIPKK